jgi:phosphoglycolate phosphatase-like HAD superfamily hydrolase
LSHWIEADAYLFDIDGTLVNSRDAVHYNAFHTALREVFGVDHKIDEVPVHGNTDIGILRAVCRLQGVGDEDFAVKLPGAIERMCDEAARNSGEMQPQRCPAVPDLLRELHERGKLLGVVSGNLEPIGWAKLEAAGLRQFFSLGSFGDRNESRADIFRYGIAQARERLGANARVCVVGDTPADIRAAREAGVSVIAVATGIFSVEQLRAEEPNACFSCCEQYFANNVTMEQSS